MAKYFKNRNALDLTYKYNELTKHHAWFNFYKLRSKSIDINDLDLNQNNATNRALNLLDHKGIINKINFDN